MLPKNRNLNCAFLRVLEREYPRRASGVTSLRICLWLVGGRVTVPSIDGLAYMMWSVTLWGASGILAACVPAPASSGCPDPLQIVLQRHPVDRRYCQADLRKVPGLVILSDWTDDTTRTGNPVKLTWWKYPVPITKYPGLRTV